MPLIHGLGQRIGYPGADVHQGGLFNAELHGDGIGRLETDAADIARQAIRVLGHDLDGVRAVGLVDAHRPRRADADHRDHAFDPRINGSDEHHGRAAVAGAVDAEPGWIHLGLRAHEGQRRLHVGDAAIGRQPGFRPIAVAPALVVETQHNVARLGEDASVLRQIDAAHAGIAVAQHDAGAPLAGLDVRWQQQIARELDALAIEGHGLRHRSPCRRARNLFGSRAAFVGSGKYRG